MRIYKGGNFENYVSEMLLATLPFDFKIPDEKDKVELPSFACEKGKVWYFKRVYERHTGKRGLSLSALKLFSYDLDANIEKQEQTTFREYDWFKTVSFNFKVGKQVLVYSTNSELNRRVFKNRDIALQEVLSSDQESSLLIDLNNPRKSMFFGHSPKLSDFAK